MRAWSAFPPDGAGTPASKLAAMPEKALTLVASDVAPVGGMERVALELCARLLERGWDLTIIARSCTLPAGPRLRFLRILAPSRPVSVALAASWLHGSLLAFAAPARPAADEQPRAREPCGCGACALLGAGLPGAGPHLPVKPPDARLPSQLVARLGARARRRALVLPSRAPAPGGCGLAGTGARHRRLLPGRG